MPEIARFEEIIILIYYSDHDPPHFHVKKGTESAMISIPNLEILKGKLKLVTFKKVKEIAKHNITKLEENWQLAKDKKHL